MRSLLLEPAWSAEDLGKPLPVMPHACSVCLPTWEATIGYEEGWPRVMDQLQSGYPRFLLHPIVVRLFEEARRELCQSGEDTVVFPSAAVCARARDYVVRLGRGPVRMAAFRGLHALVFQESDRQVARDYWKHTGEIVSSRLAEDTLAGNTLASDPAASIARLAEVMAVAADDFYLYESGMAAIFAGYQAALSREPVRKTLQVDFPYVDALKVQEQFGAGAEFLANAQGAEFSEMLERVRTGEFSAVFCEVPSNPLLRSVNLARLSSACRESKTPLVVDDTICSHHNLDVLPFADIVTTSLTKWVSGVGNVMAGSLKLNPASPLRAELGKALSENNPTHSRLYQGDAQVLVQNARGFVARIERANQSGEALAEFLQAHPAVAQVWYPKFCGRDNYESLARPGAGYGGLISFALKDPKAAPRVFDALRWSKGPSLGTEFSLACAYTLLAHYQELEWVESCGVPRNLIRLSVGMEDLGVLRESLAEALALA
jgi:cystathionine gamma-synthase